jgi:hypothetical protein
MIKPTESRGSYGGESDLIRLNPTFGKALWFGWSGINRSRESWVAAQPYKNGKSRRQL